LLFSYYPLYPNKSIHPKAYAIAQTELPDAILLDVMMPSMNGIETFAAMQANTKTIPIILLTAKIKVSEQQQFNNMAIAGVITKPFKVPQLVHQIFSTFNCKT
jgi:CheY-like chemotaxis protein